MNDQPSRQAAWARRQKLKMLQILGGKCRYCGLSSNLTFDCIRPMGHAHHKAGSVGRILFYREQMRAGNLQVLCAGCNSRKQHHAEARYRPAVLVDSDGPSRFDVWSVLAP
ncbi:MAG: hypothetical protein WA491_04370 [Candidatus Acidiferrum sp.]